MGKRRLSLAERVDKGTLIEDTLKSISTHHKSEGIDFNRADYVMGAQFMLVVVQQIMEDDGVLVEPSSRFGRRLESIQSELLEVRWNWQRREAL
jgi:hypothetical protein